MKLGIFGSGIVGQTIGSKLVTLGHQVMVGTRDLSKLETWKTENGANAQTGSFAETAAFGEILFNATLGAASIGVLTQAGAENLQGKILIDIANPLDFSGGLLSLSICNTDSLGEQIQRAFPDMHVVKSLNTTSAPIMVNPQSLALGEHDMFLCGNDANAKARVETILREWFGWKHVTDLGDLSAARGTEMVLPLWVRLYGKFQTPIFNFRVVR